ncbi:MAG: alpha-L-fucosidase [Bacteroidales bacterium]
MREIFATLSLVTLMAACGDANLYQKELVFPKNATIEKKIEMAARLVPSPQQLAWQKLETTVFFHFGINTYTEQEWGDGTEDPALFNPTELNTDQWVETIKKAGFKLAIITAKHHDGFCLWPTATTAHSVAASPWRNGKGDLVRELQQSCQKYGIKFGVYLSPWDRNAQCYGTDEYNDFFVAQLTELLTQYGTIDEVWFDGACGEGPNGKRQEYDFARYYELIKKTQANAVTAISGNDVRWVGNETGYGRETEWSATVLLNEAIPENDAQNKELGISNTSKDLGSRELLAKASKVVWWPSEVDVSIRPGWFYHQDEDSKVRSVENLANIYYSSIGQNSSLLLNIPPNKLGRIAPVDSINLIAFGEFLDNLYAKNFMASNGKWSAKAMRESKTFKLIDKAEFNVIEIAEDITKGQRIESFTIDVEKDGQWQEIAKGTTIGYKRLLRFPSLRNVAQIRVNVNEARLPFHIQHIKAYKSQEFVSAPTISRAKNGEVSLNANPTAEIKYTTDGSTPTKDSKSYTAPFIIKEKATIKAIALFDNGTQASEVITKEFEKAKSEWKVIDFSVELPNFPASNAIDGNENTMWHTPWGERVKAHPHYITVDCGKIERIKGFVFYPRHDMISGTPMHYEFYVSTDAKNWTKVPIKGEFSNIKNSPVKQSINFNRTYTMRYFKFVALDEVEHKAWTAVPEIDVIGAEPIAL